MEILELEECMDFIEVGADDIRMFSKICISFELYKKASVFISNNIDNSGITEEEKIRLEKLQQSIKYANKRKTAVNMISSGEKDAKAISQRTGIPEGDVIEMKKRLGKGEPVDINSGVHKSLEEI